MMTGSEEQRPLLADNVSVNYSINADAEAANPEDEAVGNLSIWRRSWNWFKGLSKGLVHKVFGVLLVMSAGFAFTSSNVMQKFSVKELNFWQLLANRAIVQTLVMGLICVVKQRTQRPRESLAYMFLGPTGVRKRTVVQGLLGGVLLACMFVAVKYVPLGNASAIMFCTPIFTFFMAPCMLGERLGLYRIFITLLMAFGVLFITRPTAIFGPFVQANNTSHLTMPDEAPVNYDFGSHHQTPNPHSVYAASPLLLITPEHHHFTPTQELAGYLTCIAVPFLSALISIITRQCNLAQVPVYILMFWFGIGASIVVIICKYSLIRM